jgi:hypothetical protein
MTTLPPAGRDAAPSARAGDRVFFTIVSTAIAASVFAGFAPTFYLADAAARELAPAARLHGLAGTAWVALLVVQPALSALRRVKWHRTVGRAAPYVAAAFVTSGAFVIAGVERSHGAEPLGVFAAHLFANGAPLAAYACYVALGYRLRNRDAASHKRWLLLASIVLLPAALGRLFDRLDLAAWTVPVYLACTLLNAGYDRLAYGRAHRVALSGAAVLIAIELTTDGWLALL